MAEKRCGLSFASASVHYSLGDLGAACIYYDSVSHV